MAKSKEQKIKEPASTIVDLFNDELHLLNGRCIAAFSNSTPAGKNIVIVEVGAKFFYQDINGKITGSDSNSAKVLIKPGDPPYELRSGDANGCVAQVLCIMVAEYTVGGSRQQTTVQNTHGTDAQHCLQYCPVELIVKSSLARTFGPQSPLELRFS